MEMTKDELNEIIEKHCKWVLLEEDGIRADLRGADLRGADLSRTNLSGTNLSGANLSGTDLIDADLRWGKSKQCRPK